MNLPQEIFSVFYAVLFGAMLSSLSSFKPFPWGVFYERKNSKVFYRLLKRLIISIIILNLLPVFLFVTGFLILEDYSIDYPVWSYGVNISKMIGVVIPALAALSVFLPYRVFHLYITLTRRTRGSIYGEYEYVQLVNKRNFRASKLGHGCSCIFYLILFLSLLLLNIVNNHSDQEQKNRGILDHTLTSISCRNDYDVIIPHEN